MAFEFNLRTEQKLQQRLQMSPQLYQVVEILQLTIAELQERVEQELAENPFLELVEGTAPTGEPIKSEVPIEGTREAVDADKLKETSDVWDAVSENEGFGLESRSSYTSGDEDPKLEAMMNTPGPGITLQEHLLQQVNTMDLEDELLEAARIVVLSLDPGGYLSPDYAELFENEWYDNGEEDEDPRRFNAEVVEDAVRLVRTLDPPGVGAFDIKDCLLLQLEQMPGDNLIAWRVVREYLKELAANKLPEIAKALDVTVETVIEARDIIRRLNPKPGLEFSNEPPHFVVADVIVRERDGQLEVRLNSSAMPRFRLNARLMASLRKRKFAGEEKKFVTQKKEAAHSLLNAVDQRNRILLTIVEKTVEQQRDFYLKGRAHLKPLFMNKMADEIGIDVSTVSRAVSGKYVDCPQGIIPIRMLFTAGYTTEDGDEVSDEAVKEKLKAIVNSEDKAQPLSDHSIVEILKREGISIKRRTVTKYREELEIPNSRQRKRF
jgi:RNA polymerase sigma-54 factor